VHFKTSRLTLFFNDFARINPEILQRLDMVRSFEMHPIAIREASSETYLIRDHLGSTRLAISQDGSAGYAYSYDALGKIIAEGSWGNATSLAWARYFYTGQERDEETGLQNFRARFYDEDLFRFYAMDPAGQQISPYAFVGNSPFIKVDKNGKEFITAALAAAAWGALWGGGVAGVSYVVTSAVFQQPITGGGFLKAVGLGALGGALSGGLSILGGQLGSFGTSFSYSLLSNVSSYAATNAVVGGKFDLPGVLGSLAGAAIGATFPNFQAVSDNPFINIAAELGYNSLQGGVVGGISSGLTASFRGQDPKDAFVKGLKYGAVSGAVASAVNMAVWGYAKPYDKTSLERIKEAEKFYGISLAGNLPTLRSGGISSRSKRGFSWFESSVLNTDNPADFTEVASHETVHAVQRQKLGWFKFYQKLRHEQVLYNSGIKVYDTPGYFEYEAQRLGQGLKP
jgi:RHS repeat-associated protein